MPNEADIQQKCVNFAENLHANQPLSISLLERGSQDPPLFPGLPNTRSRFSLALSAVPLSISSGGESSNLSKIFCMRFFRLSFLYSKTDMTAESLGTFSSSNTEPSLSSLALAISSFFSLVVRDSMAL